jgi:hypothetical protein
VKNEESVMCCAFLRKVMRFFLSKVLRLAIRKKKGRVGRWNGLGRLNIHFAKWIVTADAG